MKSFSFECQKCAKCCTAQEGHATLTWFDVKNIAKNLALTEDEFILNYTYVLERVHNGQIIEQLCLDAHNSGACFFLKDGLCSIHSFKPLICAAFPFLGDEKYFWNQLKVQSYCEGFGKGKDIYTENDIKKKLNDFWQENNLQNEELISASFNLKKLVANLPKKRVILS